MNDLIEKLSSLRSQFNCFDENKYEAYRTLSEAIKVISERPEPCEDDKGCSNCMYGGRSTYKSPCSECRDKSQWEMKPISRSHENGTECEDAVSRKAAIEAVMDLCKHYTPTKSVNHSHVDFVIEALQDLPPVTPKRKKGKWIHSDFSHEFLHCSQCGRGRHFCSNFCPNCGADMRQREENK